MAFVFLSFATLALAAHGQPSGQPGQPLDQAPASGDGQHLRTRGKSQWPIDVVPTHTIGEPPTPFASEDGIAKEVEGPETELSNPSETASDLTVKAQKQEKKKKDEKPKESRSQKTKRRLEALKEIAKEIAKEIRSAIKELDLL